MNTLFVDECTTTTECNALSEEYCNYSDTFLGGLTMIADPSSITITLLAYSCNCFMFYVYYAYEELQNSHPTLIIQGVIFFQAQLQLANSILFKMCEMRLPEIFAWTVYFDGS